LDLPTFDRGGGCKIAFIRWHRFLYIIYGRLFPHFSIWTKKQKGAEMQETILNFLPLIIMFLLFWYFLIRPQNKKRKLAAQKIKEIKGHDIFLSYASPDRSSAKAISDALGSIGWKVWWDRSIPAGKSFDQIIEAAIDSARCIVVLWSHTSVKSDWVKTEASEGAKRKILIPVLIEDVNIPLEFRRIQAANLIGWKSSTSHSGFQTMVSSIEELLGKAR
jgi:hypothetical protein